MIMVLLLLMSENKYRLLSEKMSILWEFNTYS